MKRVEQLITRIRRETENEEFGDTYGIPENEIIDYLNDAQDRVYREIVKTHPKFFVEQLIDTVTVNVESYSLPARIYLGQITLLEWSSNGDVRDYYRLKPAMHVERLSAPAGNPSYYIRRNKEILFAPPPGQSNGYIRLSYVKKLPKLDKRRATVSAVTLDSGTSTITSLTLDTTTTLERAELLDENYFCVVDKDGDLKMASIPFTDIDADTGVVTLGAGFTYETGESISVGDYLVRGEYTCNRSQLQDLCENYIYSHARMETQDSDSDAPGTNNQLQKMERLLVEITDAYADPHDDVTEIPVLDYSWQVEDDWY